MSEGLNRLITPKRVIFILAITILCLGVGIFGLVSELQAQSTDQIFDRGDYLEGADLPGTDLRVIVINFIRIGLGLIGIIFLIFILYGGFRWMTAGGDADKVGAAKRIIVNATIGLIIIFVALAIVTFVFNILREAVDSDSGGPNSCQEGDVSGCRRCIGGSWVFDPNLCSLPNSSFRIRDIETAHAGVDDSSDVYLCSGVQALFNNTLDPDTVAGNVSLETGGSPVPGTLESRSRSVEFVPASQLLPTTSYTIKYSNALSDASGLFLSECDPFGCVASGGEFVWNFTTGTENDSTAPGITSTRPISDQASPVYPDRNVNRDRIISVRFSEAVRAGTIDDGTGAPLAANIIVEQLADQGVSQGPPNILDPSRFEVTTRGRGFDLRLIAPDLLESFTWYRVTVQNIEDLCGNAMTAPVIWEFQTNDRSPGVRSHYPTGTNVCPDVGAITLSFSTDMFHDAVDIAISPGSPSAPPTMNGILRASDLAPGPYRVTGTGGTWEVDPDSSFTVFTFTPATPLTTNTAYFISVATDRIIDINGTSLTDDWNFAVTDAGTCTCAPHISSVNPNFGFLGQCVTVRGQCFLGAVPGDVLDPRHAQITDLSFNLAGENGVSATVGGQGPNFVTTSIPTSFSQADAIFPQITIAYNDSNLGSLSTDNQAADFFIASAELAQGPCLLNISPGSACFGTTVSLTGLRFGPDPPGGRATDQDNVTFADGPTRVPEAQVTSWTDTRIQASVPSNASDGGVTVTASGLISNSIPFDLACGVGASCSSNPNQCVQDRSRCAAGLTCSETTCRCESSEPPGTPTVVDETPTCSRSCANVGISAVFSEPMDPSTISGSSVEVRPCAADCTLDNLEAPVSLTNVSYDPALQQVNIAPASELAPGTSYRVILFGTDEPTRSETAMRSEAGIALSGLIFDRDGDGIKDSDSWTFGTKSEACQVTGVSIEPVSTSADRLGQAVSFNAYAQGVNESCGAQDINRYSLDWQWASSAPAVATMSPVDSNNDSRLDPTQRATVTGEGITLINAASSGFKADGTLNVNIITCDETTDCTRAGQCFGSVCDQTTRTCTPIINSLSPAVGPFGRWTTISGCYFGSSQGSGSVDFGDLQASFPACGAGTWQNEQIIVEVPDLPGGDHGVTVSTSRGLVSNPATFTVTGECLAGIPVPDTGVPGICRLRPSAGAINRDVTIEGQHFGLSQNNPVEDQVTYAGISGRSVATISSWGSASILTSVPPSAVTGSVITEVNSCPSNGLDFTVTIGPGTSCDGNVQVAACQANDSMCGQGTGLRCNRDSCTCETASAPSVVSAQPSGADACRNATVEVTFDQLMDSNSLRDNVLLERDNNGLPCDQNPLETWCSVSTSIQTVSIDVDDNGELDPLVDHSIARLSAGVLEANEDYRVRVLPGAKNRFGVTLGGEFTQTFITGDLICQINRVEVLVQPPRRVQASDHFFCAGINNCPNDQNAALIGNQHEWAAQAYDTSNRPISATYEWAESDPEELFELTSPDTNDTFITALGGNGSATMTVRAHDPLNLSVGEASASVLVTADLCENPWPEPGNFPFKDLETGFSFYYCRDRGSARVCIDSAGNVGSSCSSTDDCQVGEFCRLDPRDDLPDLQIIQQPGSSPDPNLKKEFLLLRKVGDPSQDAIALQVLSNPDHLNPQAWYGRNVPNPGSASNEIIDGFDAVRDGRTLYVNAANAKDAGNNSFENNIYLLSYNNNADPDTRKIYDELEDSWKFAITLKDLNICTGNPGFFCEADFDCVSSLPPAGICQVDATRLRRDSKRISDLGGLAELLRLYRGRCENDLSRGCIPGATSCQGGAECLEENPTFPKLTAGSFIIGQSTSKWPSWQETLGGPTALDSILPEDPINEFSQCPIDANDPNAANFDTACWDKNRKIFECAPGSHLYQYETLNGGVSAKLYANMELKGKTWLGTQTLNSGSSDICKSFSLNP